MKVTIYRDRWLRGPHVNSMLRNSEGMMCCLGFVGEACGIRAHELFGQGTPTCIDSDLFHKWPAFLLKTVAVQEDGHEFYADSDLANNLMGDNDAELLDEMERERRIAARFAEHGIEITFVDGVGP